MAELKLTSEAKMPESKINELLDKSGLKDTRIKEDTLKNFMTKYFECLLEQYKTAAGVTY